jgi:hypothetical protein
LSAANGIAIVAGIGSWYKSGVNAGFLSFASFTLGKALSHLVSTACLYLDKPITANSLATANQTDASVFSAPATPNLANPAIAQER